MVGGTFQRTDGNGDLCPQMCPHLRSDVKAPRRTMGNKKAPHCGAFRGSTGLCRTAADDFLAEGAGFEPAVGY